MTQQINPQFEEVLPRIDSQGQNPFEDEGRHPTRPAVLDAVDTTDAFTTSPVSVLCPGCGTVVNRYRNGLPSRIAHFTETCETCETKLLRWCSVVLNSAYEALPTQATLKEVTTTYWDENLWKGIVTGEHCPRTEEYTEAYTQQARTFGWNWSVTCPLCRLSIEELGVSRLDYHHWQREPDQGICLCRPCHTAIGGGKTDSELDWEAQQLGLRNKHDLQLTRLALREQVVATHDTLKALVATITERYNLIQSRTVVFSLLFQTLQSPAVLDQVRDEHLSAGLPNDMCDYVDM